MSEDTLQEIRTTIEDIYGIRLAERHWRMIADQVHSYVVNTLGFREVNQAELKRHDLAEKLFLQQPNISACEAYRLANLFMAETQRQRKGGS